MYLFVSCIFGISKSIGLVWMAISIVVFLCTPPLCMIESVVMCYV